MREPLAAEAAADIGSNDTHALGRQPECRGHSIPDHVRALVGIVEREFIVAPDGNGRVRFERIVVLGGRGIGVIERDGSRSERGLDIPALRIKHTARDESRRCVQITAVSAQFHLVWLLLVADHDQARCLPRYLQGLGDDGGDDLPAIGHRIGLEDRQILVEQIKPKREPVIKRREPWGVLVRKHGDDTRQRTRGARVDRDDVAPGNRALDREDVRDVVNRVFIGICCRTGDLLNPVETVERRAARARYEMILHF